jgi:hypothetical protein
MEKLGVIATVEQPTDWCAGMVVVPKENGKVRICVDLTKLNESVRRERHPLLAVDQVLVQLSGATTFSKMDANSDFWQVPLSPESANLQPIWAVLLLQAAIWHRFSSRDLLTTDVPCAFGTARDCLHDGRCSSNTGRTQ